MNRERHEVSRTSGPERSIVARLIAKDLYLHRWMIPGALVAGIASLVASHFSDGDNLRTGPNLGFILFMTTVITFGILVAMLGILKERQERSRLFVLGLPVSPAQYSFAKVAAALVAFLVPWSVLTAGVAGLAFAGGGPRGFLPFFVVIMTFFLANFCLLLAVVAITLSEIWSVVGILVTNVSVPLFLTRAGSYADAAERAGEAAATWSPQILALLAIEGAQIVLALGLAIYLPARRKEFL